MYTLKECALKFFFCTLARVTRKSLIPRIMEFEELRLGNDDWWQFKDRVAKFNADGKEKV